jgi:hypothetical protein
MPLYLLQQSILKFKNPKPQFVSSSSGSEPTIKRRLVLEVRI